MQYDSKQNLNSEADTRDFRFANFPVSYVFNETQEKWCVCAKSIVSAMLITFL